MMHIPIKPNKKHIFGCESCFVKRQKLREKDAEIGPFKKLNRGYD